MWSGVAMTELCEKPTRCPSILGKDNTGCGHRVLYGPTACWRRDGRPERKAGLSGEGWRIPFQYGENEERGKYW